MSNLNNPPLIEIQFKIWWHLSSLDDQKKAQFLLGDFHSVIKKEFPNRNIVSNPNSFRFDFFEDGPSHAFMLDGPNFPQIRMSRRMMTLTSDDNNYDWRNFSEMALRNCEKLIDLLKDLLNPDHYHLELMFVDFIPFNINKEDVLKYLSSNLNTDIQMNYFNSNLSSFGMNLESKTAYGKKSITFGEGDYNNKNGIIIRTLTESKKVEPKIQKIKGWLEMAHNDCSQTFKKMTEGTLYDSFNK